MQEHQVEVVQKKHLAPEIIELSVKPIKPRVFRFRAGQFAFFNVGGAYKAYSMASAPADRRNVRFLIKLEAGGRGSAFVAGLKPGDRFIFTGPEGYFTVGQRRRDVCCVASGIGVAPFVSIIPHLLKKKYAGRITLLYGTGTENEICYKAEFEKLSREHPNFKFVPMLSRPGPSWRGATGRVTSYLQKHGREFLGSAFYVCGKQQAVEEAERTLVRLGSPPADIHTEIFLR